MELKLQVVQKYKKKRYVTNLVHA